MQPDGDYVRSPNKDLPGLRFQSIFMKFLQGEHSSSAAKGIGID
jgi:hypothetical protein